MTADQGLPLNVVGITGRPSIFRGPPRDEPLDLDPP